MAQTGASEPASPPGGEASAATLNQETPPAPLVLPLPVFLAFLRRLHDGPPQHAAAVRVALAVWQGAVDRGDVAQAREAVAMVRTELDRLLASLSELQEIGRRCSSVRSPEPGELAAAAWEAERRGQHEP